MLLLIKECYKKPKKKESKIPKFMWLLLQKPQLRKTWLLLFMVMVKKRTQIWPFSFFSQFLFFIFFFVHFEGYFQFHLCFLSFCFFKILWKTISYFFYNLEKKVRRRLNKDSSIISKYSLKFRDRNKNFIVNIFIQKE